MQACTPRSAWQGLVPRLLCLAALALHFAGAQAGDYPTRPVTIVVGFAAGGGVDAVARIVAEKLPALLGQPVVVENRPGVGAVVGATYVARAKPDGYTLIMGAPGPMIFNHALGGKMPYGPHDFAPISFVSNSPLVLLVNASSSIRNVQDLVAFARQNPDQANYSASSTSFQLMTELFNRKTGVRFTHIPYKGANESVTAVMAGDVTMTLADAGPASVGLQSGRVRAVAVATRERLKDLPGVPTLAEQGVDLQASVWIGLLAPAGTPREIVMRLNQEVAKIVQMPDVQQRMHTMGIVPVSNTPEEFQGLIDTEIPQWRQLAADNHISAN